VELIRLSLTDWRGVAARDIAFGPGVTIIEGPNESGKSTIVQALYTLFKELDSSKKKEVRAIQPVGRDVGSAVKAEIKSGDYHFVYAKTYNKRPATELRVLGPAKVQLTGREAHERAEQMLSETVDMALWEALLVSQGEKIELSNLQDSDGLAKALDEAAGSSQSSHEDSRLIDAVQLEYEQYYSLKAGKPRFADLEQRCKNAKTALDDAERQLQEVEADVREHERVVAEVRRLQASLPALEASVRKHRQAWDAIQFLQGELQAKQKALEAAMRLQRAADEQRADRERAIEDIAQAVDALGRIAAKHGPLKARVAAIDDELAKAKLLVGRQREQEKTTRAAAELARRDAEYLGNQAELEAQRRRLDELGELAKKRSEALGTAGAIKVTDRLLDEIRAADRELAIAESKRNTAATRVTVTAEQDLALELNAAVTPLEADESHTETVAASMTLRLPGVACIEVAPSASVAELKEAADEAGARLEAKLGQAGAAGLSDAVAAHQQRAAAMAEAEHMRQRQRALLGERSEDEIRRYLSELEQAGKYWQQERGADTPLPASADAARVIAKDAGQAYQEAVTALESARGQAERLQDAFDEQDSQLRIADKDMAGHKAALASREAELARQRKERPDDVLAREADEATAASARLREELEGLQARLAAQSPDAARALLENAEAARQRALEEQRDAETRRAVLADRLQSARADGRYDALEAAGRRHAALQAELARTGRRARAARRLWDTLNRHRDAARQRYVQPLREAIEGLGAIVFGESFEVTIGEDWSVVTCTRDGETLPFDDLSVGTKEQLSILSRLAAAQIVSSQGGVPLIIDDALGFSDPERLESMGAAIAAAAKRCQIVILTCTPGRFAYIGSADVVNL